ncbi:MAG: SDR family oxidoreductase [Synechococcus sp.]
MATNSKKTALVTGGNRGIGFAICQGLLARGFDVILAARSPEKGQAAVAKLSAGGKSVTFLQLDMDSDASIEQATTQLSQAIEKLDILINNAGIYPDHGATILTASRALLTRTMNTNSFGPIKLIQNLLPLLEKAEDARIINISSGNGQLDGLSTSAPSYSLSKLALNGITILMADALRNRNIAVYSMCPGWVRTDMGGQAAPRSPEEGADTAIWLATEGTLEQSGQFFRDRQPQPF